MSMFLAILVAVVVAWIIKGKIEAKKREEYNAQKQKARESAVIALNHLRLMSVEPYGGIHHYREIENEQWNNLEEMRKDPKSLKEIGTTSEEIGRLWTIENTKNGFGCCMHNLTTTDYSAEMFEFYLENRATFLAKNSKTLADFGIVEDDTETLRRDFRIRHAKYLRKKAGWELSKAMEHIRCLATTLQIPNEDFGMDDVYRRLDGIQELK